MSQNQPSDSELALHLEPWFPLFGRVFENAMLLHKAGIPILGLPRKTERANDLHRTIRENFRAVAERSFDLIELKEESEGQGLDYLLWRIIPDKPFTMRWGRRNSGTIYRNRTQRTKELHEQGTLFGTAADEEAVSSMPTCSVGYTIEDDYTEVGKSKCWIGRLYLVRERPVQSKVITEVHVYSPPIEDEESFEAPPPVVTAREAEIEEWGEIINQIRRIHG